MRRIAVAVLLLTTDDGVHRQGEAELREVHPIGGRGRDRRRVVGVQRRHRCRSEQPKRKVRRREARRTEAQAR